MAFKAGEQSLFSKKNKNGLVAKNILSDQFMASVLEVVDLLSIYSL